MEVENSDNIFLSVQGPIVYYVPGGGGVGGVQFLKRVNFWGQF